MNDQAAIEPLVEEGENGETFEENIESHNKHDIKKSTFNSIEESGRIKFKGEDMLFLTVNGIQMFTFYEIMLKLCQGTKRGTVGNRFTRLKATKHACNRAEVDLVKELGGTKQAFSNCTLVSREDVERYWEKYSEKSGSNDATDQQEPEGSNLNINIPNSCNSDLILEQCKPDHTSLDLVSDDKNMDINKVMECQNIFKGKKPKIGNQQKKAIKASKKPVKDGANLVKGSRVGKKSTSKSVSSNLATIQVDENVRSLSPVATIDSISDENMQENGKKRKRRTQMELLQSYQFYTDITEDENTIPGQKCALDANSKQLKADALSLDMNSNIVDDQAETRFDYDNFDEPYSEANNNGSNYVEPRSPTLLLKRSHNKWHVANGILPQSGLNDAESEDISDNVMKSDNNSGGLKPAMTKLKDKLKCTKKRKLPHAISKEKSGKKKKIVDKDLHPLATVRKVGKNSLKKTNEANKKGKKRASLTEQEKTNLEGSFDPDIAIVEMKPDTSNNTNVSEQNFDGRKGLLGQDGINNLSKTLDESKEKRENNDEIKIVKKKRRRRLEMNTFRLIETIPYSAFLVVKDGDLSPSHTMAYNKKNCLPGCCHALWRWRLGKPVSMPSQSPVKSTDVPLPSGKANINDLPLNKILQDEQSPVQTKFGYSSPTKSLQDEPLKPKQDNSSTIEEPGDLQSQQFSCEMKDNVSVETRQEHYSLEHDKLEGSPLAKTKRENWPAEDAKEKEERPENKDTEESINTDAVLLETSCAPDS
ncbi:uncharacterized protein LOC114522253 [Dendronephthya gigantea]|uniref:uncharacterized protein LOC114522253 n=1 Tax=Dendronephthya gigantea TaxID=151771 RepID=UPI001069880C|nr:uncharacterized protein LOC114522253 [Dendronephthya gigantea]